jgi:hypothetical protein
LASFNGFTRLRNFQVPASDSPQSSASSIAMVGAFGPTEKWGKVQQFTSPSPPSRASPV